MTSVRQGAPPLPAPKVNGLPGDGLGLTRRASSRRERVIRVLITVFSWPGWKSVGAVATSVVAIGTAVVAYGTFKVSKQTVQLSEQTLQANTRQQASDRYSKAIEHLGSDNLDVRLGGIYALDTLATDTPTEHQDVYNVLTSFVRGHAAVGTGACADSNPVAAVANSPTPLGARTALTAAATTDPRPSEDIQTVIYVVGRRDRTHDAANESVDFSHTCLRGASFLAETAADYSDVSMNSSDLRGANLGLARLENVYLYGATLDDALIVGSKLRGARLSYAHLWRAGLSGTDLRGAHLANADLTKANLCDANLSGADLGGANLTDVLYGDGTVWPSGFTPPPSRPGAC
ncbi:pentapeptide repeat-containing protein [Mycobacterium paraense]|uniref:pentapeptide repeat-containing protein n=1 Tax=Mycobacterium paraense TaxID=767916 RepID=UPI000A1594DC|nr:pentapeptide repeat-containing protein [Mycobacterium paraense]